VGAAEFSAEDQRVALAFADQIALAYEGARFHADLSRLNAELQQYVHVVLHHLQEPLRTVQGFSQLLTVRYASKLDGDAPEFLGFIQNGVRPMRSLVQDLGEYAQVSSPENPALTFVSLKYAAQGARDAWAQRIERAGATLDIGDLPTVKGNAAQFRQVFLHLIDNALNFCSPAPPQIVIRAEEREGFHMIAVKDNGMGIEPRHQERIFQIFERLHAEDPEATGIGLALCRKIVERHGGRIWVESSGAGSTFFFTVPIVRASASPED